MGPIQKIKEKRQNKATLEARELANRNAADLNIERNPEVLHQAVLDNNYFLVEAMINNGVDPDKRNAEGKTPLEIAINQVNSDMVDLLVKSGKTGNEEVLNLAVQLLVGDSTIEAQKLLRIRDERDLHIRSTPAYKLMWSTGYKSVRRKLKKRAIRKEHIKRREALSTIIKRLSIDPKKEMLKVVQMASKNQPDQSAESTLKAMTIVLDHRHSTNLNPKAKTPKEKSASKQLTPLKL